MCLSETFQDSPLLTFEFSGLTIFYTYLNDLLLDHLVFLFTDGHAFASKYLFSFLLDTFLLRLDLHSVFLKYFQVLGILSLLCFNQLETFFLYCSCMPLLKTIQFLAATTGYGVSCLLGKNWGLLCPKTSPNWVLMMVVKNIVHNHLLLILISWNSSIVVKCCMAFNDL